MKTDVMNQVSLKNSIATQLLIKVFSLYLIITFVVTVIHMTAAFYEKKTEIQKEIEIISKTFAPGLAKALWDYNLGQLRPIFSGMLDYPVIVGMKLEDNNGVEIEGLGIIKNSDGSIIEKYKDGNEKKRVNFSRIFKYSFPITMNRKGKEFSIGTANIFSATSVIFDKLKLGFFFIIVNAIIKTACLWMIFIWISRRILLRPLVRLTAATEKIDFDNLEEVHIDIKIKEKNELKILEKTFNDLIKRLFFEHSQLLSLTKELEQRVEERTAELSETNERLRKRIIQHEKTIIELEKALNEIKTLRGILPICSHCKKIRDDKGYWSQIESYIQKHSDAEFSHSMCPECSDELYGKEDWYIEMKKEENQKE